jgi:hypothetical protein
LAPQRADWIEPGRLGPPLYLVSVDGDKHPGPMKGIIKTMNQKLKQDWKKLVDNGLMPFTIFILGSAVLILIGIKLW